MLARDEKLFGYCTDRQREILVAYWDAGCVAAEAARRLGISASTVKKKIAIVARKAAQQGYAPAYDLTHAVPEGMRSKGVSILYGPDGEVREYWNKSTIAGMDPDDAHKLPDPKRVRKLSTLYDAQGKVIQQWMAEEPTAEAREMVWREFAAALKEDLPRASPVECPTTSFGHVLACYPIGDHHVGQLSWGVETLQPNYDLKTAERRLLGAIDHLVSVTPPSDDALLVFLGDFMHYDSFEAITPTNHNRLDPDSRFPKMVRVAIRTMRYVIETVLKHHRNVRLIIEIGNHDLASSIFLMEAMSAIYEHEPRLSIDVSPAHYHYYRWGANLIGTHHGHGAKFSDLPLIMASDMPGDWGSTDHRYWWTGHIHKATAHDFNGCKVESFRVLTPPDAWAANQGYRPQATMQAIILHAKHGEVSRYSVNPAMIQ